MKENIKAIVLKGLYQDNLTKLTDLCKQNLQEDPSLFFILESIFKSLEAEYDNQAITLERYNKVMTLLPNYHICFRRPFKKQSRPAYLSL